MASITANVAQWPSAVVPALRMVWSKTLFAGPTCEPGRPRAASIFALIVLPAVLLYPCLHFHLLEPDEGRYAEIPREMLARGEWVVPYLQSEPYLDKPPLLYWLIMVSYRVFGVSDWAARLVPALAVHGCILACYLFGCRLFRERQALRGALILSIMPGLISIGRLLTMDSLLTLWVTLGLFAGFRYVQSDKPRWAFCVWALACALGVLTKGPIALVLALAPLIAWRWLHKDRRVRLGTKTWATFGAVVLAINLPWYVAMSFRQPGFLKYFFWQHNLERFFNPFDHIEPIWYYGPILFAGLLPAALWLWPVVRTIFAGDTESSARRSPELAFCLLAGLGCVVFFSLSGSKLPTYILPAFPPLALAMGVLLERGERLFTKSHWYAGAGWIVIALVAHYWFVPAYAQERSPMREEAVMTQLCGDPNVTVVCHPRTCDSVSFYLNRADLHFVRSKNTPALIEECMSRPKTLILFSHRHSLPGFEAVLPKELKLTHLADFRRHGKAGLMATIGGMTPWGLCDVAMVERVVNPSSDGARRPAKIADSEIE